MKDCTVVLTCCGGLISPSHIQSLRIVAERKIRIIGVDANPEVPGAFLVDKFYPVPFGTDPDYIPRMLEICREVDADVVLPCSHEESLALVEHREEFRVSSTAIATSDHETLTLAYDKGKAYTFLQSRGLPVAPFHLVHSLQEFKEAAHSLGYPNKPVVMKPPFTRGGRGARILAPSGGREALFAERPGSLLADFDSVLRLLEGDDFPELLVMERLGGNFYSVDMLVQEGQVLAAVPKVRIQGTPSQTLYGQVRKDSLVEDVATQVCQAFAFSYNVNVEIAYTKEGQPVPYDINPRVAASTAFCTAAGANLLYYAVKMALGEDIPHIQVKDGVRMMRFLRELYITDDRTFYL